MPIPGFTAEDSLYESAQNYSNLHFWSTSPSSTRILRPRQWPQQPPRMPLNPPRIPLRPPRNPPRSCDKSKFDTCRNSAGDKLNQCIEKIRHQKEESLKLGPDELAPLLRNESDCWMTFLSEEKKCFGLYGCLSGRCSDIGICCPEFTVGCN